MNFFRSKALQKIIAWVLTLVVLQQLLSMMK